MTTVTTVSMVAGKVLANAPGDHDQLVERGLITE